MAKQPRENAPVPTSADRERLAASLAKAGEDLRQAGADLAAASGALDAVIVQGYKAGAPIKWMTQAAGVNRKTVYSALERNGLYQPGAVKAWMSDTKEE